MKAVLIYSGGMDSTVLLYKYRKEIKLAVTFTYGARQDEEQTACAKENCKLLGIEHLIIPLEFMGKYFRSSILKGGDDVPHGSYNDENMKSTVVPFRNGIMLSIAAGLAESRELDTVLIANHAGDHTIYPDCRPEFIEAMGSAVNAGTFAGIKIVSPFCDITKRDIALIGKEEGVPFEKTYSCYEGRHSHCGVCGTCVERKEALEGFDPTEYEK
ncbi:MAG: 7-cyano-7-deazaguanine synthase QueC [Bacteroidales bacterium]|nr:7-cyano-7-deazaguanine synthase QueC [Bacteroidales bacterium]MBR4408105.1 7-cyano-7-deazaguanine synthase QueC [Bacteroidales bacterium]MCR5243265.1 7-cyano-7-deazaguanine synthase QueC [Bacteroidales bacterium]